LKVILWLFLELILVQLTVVYSEQMTFTSSSRKTDAVTTVAAATPMAPKSGDVRFTGFTLLVLPIVLQSSLPSLCNVAPYWS